MSNHAREDSMMAASVGRGSVPADPQSRLKNRWCDRIKPISTTAAEAASTRGRETHPRFVV